MKLPRLVPNWRAVVLHSWSFRINVVIALCSAVDAGITYFVDGRASTALVVAGVSLIASVARLVKQATVSGEEKE